MAYAKSGRAKGQISLKSSGSAKNASRLNPNATATVGIRGAKASKNIHSPRLHGRVKIESLRTASSKTSTRLGSPGPLAMNTVGLRGSSVPKNKTTSTNLRKTSPRAINSQGLKKASKRAPKQSLQSAGTGKLYTGGRGLPLAGNRRVVVAAKNASGIPAVIRRAASRHPANGSSKPSFTSRVVKITSK